MQLVLLAAFALLGVVGASFLPSLRQPTPELHTQWTGFKLQHRKNYGSAAEELKRRLQWEQNLALIDQHNQAYARGEFSFDLAMNHLGDLHQSEVQDMLNGYTTDLTTSGETFNMDAVNQNDIPATVDWRESKIVTPVKNQGQCGSCWAFSATGSLEGQTAKKTGTLVSLSEQQLMDCSTTNHGCRGGLMTRSFDYIKETGGIQTEDSYPYTPTDGHACKFNKSAVAATVTGYTKIARGDEAALTAAIATIGPISIGIDASASVFHFYHSGVFYNSFCSATRLDHAVLAVGYGTLDGKDYFLVKTSWTETWGQDGYIKMSRNKSNNCGIATDAVYPLV